MTRNKRTFILAATLASIFLPVMGFAQDIHEDLKRFNLLISRDYMLEGFKNFLEFNVREFGVSRSQADTILERVESYSYEENLKNEIDREAGGQFDESELKYLASLGDADALNSMWAAAKEMVWSEFMDSRANFGRKSVDAQRRAELDRLAQFETRIGERALAIRLHLIMDRGIVRPLVPSEALGGFDDQMAMFETNLSSSDPWYVDLAFPEYCYTYRNIPTDSIAMLNNVRDDKEFLKLVAFIDGVNTKIRSEIVSFVDVASLNTAK